MSDNKTVEKARKLYESGSYKEAFDLCSELISAEDVLADKSKKSEVKEALLISAYSIMNMSDAPPSDNLRTVICNSVSTACECADSIDEVQQIEEEVDSEFDRWREKSIKAQLKKVENNPSFETWGAYYPLMLEYTKLSLFLHLATRNNSVVNQYCETEGIDRKEYVDQCKKYQEKFTDEDIDLLEYEAANKIFGIAKIELERNADVNADYAQVISKQIVEHLFVAELAAGSSIGKDLTPEVRNERLKTQAEIIDYKLRALISPNGKVMSLFQGNRQGEIDKLKRIYSQIKESEPDFVEPELPSAQAVGATTTAANTGSGGCYVATAVYGSYDCPQVWTLRRYRDYTLAETWYGRAFIRTYYAVSPTLVAWFGDKKWFKNLFKSKLDTMVNALNKEGVSDKPYLDKQW